MTPGLVLVVNLSVAVALLAVAADRRLGRWASRHPVALAALPLLTAILLTVYVFGEDSYRGNGISRWEAYASPVRGLGSMFVVSVALMAACAALLLYGGKRGNESLLRVTALGGGLTCLLLLTATIIGFNLN